MIKKYLLLSVLSILYGGNLCCMRGGFIPPYMQTGILESYISHIDQAQSLQELEEYQTKALAQITSMNLVQTISDKEAEKKIAELNELVEKSKKRIQSKTS